MAVLVILGILMFIAFILLIKSQKKFSKKGYMCPFFCFISLGIAFFAFGIKWWIMLLFLLFLIWTIFLWITIEKENNENIETATGAAESVNNFFGNIANSLSGGNSFLNDVFGAVANATSSRVNDKFGFDSYEESTEAPAGRIFNKVYFVASLIVITIAYFCR